MKVLFVCSGNICRSPAAAAYLKHRASALGVACIDVDSAGTLGIEGQSMCPDAATVLGEQGIAAGEHRSKGVRDGDVRAADWIITMERSHLAYLAIHHPEGNGRRLLLRAFERGSTPAATPADLEDPYGQPIDVYRKQMPLIGRCVDHFLRHIHPGP